MVYSTYEKCEFKTMAKTLPKFCNRCQTYFDEGKYCNCPSTADPNKPKLNLYMVTVNVLSINKMPGAPVGYRTYILDSNKVDAEARVIQLLGPDRVNYVQAPRVEEVKGPFSKGQVLFWDEF